MAPGRTGIQAAAQRESKVRARTISTSNSLLLFPERVGGNNAAALRDALASHLWRREQKRGVAFE